MRGCSSARGDAACGPRERLASADAFAAPTIASDDLADRVGAEPGGGQQLLGALLGAREDRARLRAGPFERLLDLGTRGVRQLGRLVARLLEQPGALRLGFVELGRRVAVRIREQLARLGLRGVDDLVALALALVAEALDLALALLQVALAPA